MDTLAIAIPKIIKKNKFLIFNDLIRFCFSNGYIFFI